MSAPPDLPLVSVVTPSYRQADFIRATLDSVLGQDYPRIEYLVMDGGSDDGTVDILRSYGERLRWVSEPDGGQAAAVNKGWALAEGEILGWLNSDDRYTPGAVRRAVDYLAAHPEADGVYGHALLEALGGRALGRFPTARAVDFRGMKGSCPIAQPSVFLRRSAVRRVGGLRNALHMVMDQDLWLRLLRDGRLDFIDADQAVCLMHPGSKTSLGGRLRARELAAVMTDACVWVNRVHLYDRAYATRHALPQDDPGAPRLVAWERAYFRVLQLLLFLGVNVLGAPWRLLRGPRGRRGDLG